MHLPLSLLLLLLATTALLTSTAPLSYQPPGESSECALSLVALSPCLSYIAGPPNRPAPAPSVICCGTFYQAIVNAGPTCMCYLVRDPLILGFPVDTGRLVAMFPSCGVNNTASAAHWLYDSCRVAETETLSPLPAIAPATAPATAPAPAPASTINPSSAEQWTPGLPTPEESSAPYQVGRTHFWGSLLIIWFMLSINLHV